MMTTKGYRTWANGRKWGMLSSSPVYVHTHRLSAPWTCIMVPLPHMARPLASGRSQRAGLRRKGGSLAEDQLETRPSPSSRKIVVVFLPPIHHHAHPSLPIISFHLTSPRVYLSRWFCVYPVCIGSCFPLHFPFSSFPFHFLYPCLLPFLPPTSLPPAATNTTESSYGLLCPRSRATQPVSSPSTRFHMFSYALSVVCCTPQHVVIGLPLLYTGSRLH